MNQTTQIVTTGGIHRTKNTQPGLRSFIESCLRRHLSGDWGDLDPNDAKANEQAIAHRDRLLSSYDLSTVTEVDTNFGPATAERLWIITDPGWATTTILWPIEY